jgi:hypothetical protein
MFVRALIDLAQYTKARQAIASLGIAHVFDKYTLRILKMNEDNMRIFLAALQGFVSNKDFHQGSPEAAVEFARACVRAAYGNDPYRSFPLVT